MKVYTYSEARQQLAEVLDRAQREGSVKIRRRDGSTFVVARERSKKSPLDVPGVDVDLTRDEILDFIRAGRRTG